MFFNIHPAAANRNIMHFEAGVPVLVISLFRFSALIVQRTDGREDLFVQCDMSQKDAFTNLFTYGKIDVIVNCGVYGGRGMTSQFLYGLVAPDFSIYGETPNEMLHPKKV